MVKTSVAKDGGKRGSGACIPKAEPMGFADVLTANCDCDTSSKNP